MPLLIAILGTVGLLAFTISSVAVGIRCLTLARRTRGLPELAIGLAFVVGAVVGYVPETVVLSSDLLSPGLESRILLITQVAIRGAAVAVMAFTLGVFRPVEWWARIAAGTLLLLLAVSWVQFPSTRSLAQTPSDIFWYDVFAVARSLPLAWGATEALIFHAKSKRRLRLGISDPMLTNRFLLWGIGLGSMTLLMASTLLASAIGIDPAAHGWVLVESMAGLTGAATLWLTFFPSKIYKRFIHRREGSVGEVPARG